MAELHFDQAAHDADRARLLRDPSYTSEQVEYELDRTRRFYCYVVCCDTRLYVPNFTNTCEVCERDFNSSGQSLAPRSQWGEETGESASDILNAEAAGFPDVEY